MEQPHFIVFLTLDYTISFELVKLLFMFHFIASVMRIHEYDDVIQRNNIS